MMVLRKWGLLFGMLIFFSGLFAQSLTDAGEKYNAGNEKYKAREYGDAVKLYEEAFKICKSIGASATGLQTDVEKQLMNAYFLNGLTFYKRRKFDEAIVQLQKAGKMAKEIGNKVIQKKSVKYIARVHASKGIYLLKSKDISGAFAEYDKALKVKPDCSNAFYGRALAYKDKGDMEQMKLNVDKVIELEVNNAKAIKKVAKAKRLAFTGLMNAGAEELKKEHDQKALGYLTDALKYGKGNADIYRYIAIANLGLKKWDASIKASDKSLTLEKNNKSDIYFTLAQAYQGKGENSKACITFKKVKNGPNVKVAKYQITQVLKCK